MCCGVEISLWLNLSLRGSIFSTLIKAPRVKSLIGGEAFSQSVNYFSEYTHRRVSYHNWNSLTATTTLHRSWRKMSLTLRFKFNCFPKANRLAMHLGATFQLCTDSMLPFTTVFRRILTEASSLRRTNAHWGCTRIQHIDERQHSALFSIFLR